MKQSIARCRSVHGVFMDVFSLGVLITGASGAGKSDLALDLITRGHQLVADDSPDMTLTSSDVIDGSCPEVLRDCLRVQDLGVLNVRAMFGDAALKPNQTLHMIVHLNRNHAAPVQTLPLDPLQGASETLDILGLKIPQITLSVSPGRNLAVLLEAAVRNQRLKLNGFNAANEFIQRQRNAMKETSL
ncbi:MAG: hypothetical protein AB8B96_06335 [Lysobacterales bacterium]